MKGMWTGWSSCTKVVKSVNLIRHSKSDSWNQVARKKSQVMSLLRNFANCEHLQQEFSFPFSKNNSCTTNGSESELEIRPKRLWKCGAHSHVMVRVVTVVIVLPSPLMSWISEVSFPKVVPNEALVNGEVADVLSPGVAPLCASCSLADKRCSRPRAKAESL